MKILKRALLAVVVLLILAAGAIAAIVVPMFAGALPIQDAEVAPGVRQVKDGHTSVFLLDGGSGELGMIDCGDDSSGAAILAALSAKGFKPEQVTSIFLTHGHPDHVAACKLFPKAEVYAFPQDVLLAAGQEAAKGPLVKHLGPNPESKRTKVTRMLEEGQQVTIGNLTVRALATPGHTGGSASYFVNGALILGDNAMGKNDGVHAAPWPVTEDQAQNRASLKKLYEQFKAEGTVKTLAFAHTGPMQGIEPLGSVKE